MLHTYSVNGIPGRWEDILRTMHEPRLGLIVRDMDEYRRTQGQVANFRAWVTFVEHEGEVLGWSLYCVDTRDNWRSGSFQVYVDPGYRRQGLGSYLWLNCRFRFPDIDFGHWSHNRGSRRFFAEMAKYKTKSVKNNVDGGLQDSNTRAKPKTPTHV